MVDSTSLEYKITCDRLPPASEGNIYMFKKALLAGLLVGCSILPALAQAPSWDHTQSCVTTSPASTDQADRLRLVHSNVDGRIISMIQILTKNAGDSFDTAQLEVTPNLLTLDEIPARSTSAGDERTIILTIENDWDRTLRALAAGETAVIRASGQELNISLAGSHAAIDRLRKCIK